MRRVGWLSKILGFIEKHEPLIVILCLVALVRIPSLYEPSRYADEDIYLTIGQNLKHGLVLYRDIYDNKTPFIYYLAGLAGSVTGFRFILLIWNTLNIFFVWKVAEKLLSKRWGVIGATILFAIFTTIPLLEGEIANGEVFMILPTTIAVYLLFEGGGKVTESSKKLFLSGIFWSMAFLFKTPPLIEMAGVFFYLTIYRATSITDLFTRLKGGVWLILAGFFLPVLITFIYFFEVGAIREYVFSVYVSTIPYLSAWSGGGGGQSSGIVGRGVVLMAVLGIVLIVRKKLTASFAFCAIWFCMALFGALLSGRPYPHYLIEIVAPASLLLAFAVFEGDAYRRSMVMGLFFILAVSVVRYQFWHYKSLPYYQNFGEYMLGQKSKEDYWRFWGENVIHNYKAANYIRTTTSPSDSIFVWGTEPSLYWLTNRRPVSKYIVAYHIHDFDAKDEVYEQIVEKEPKIIVVVNNERPFSKLSGLLTRNYAVAKKFGNLEVYLRLL